MEARRRTFRNWPLSHPEERPAVSRANDLRRRPGQVGRVGGIRYLPYEWAPASLRRSRRVAERPGRQAGWYRGSSGSRPGTGRRHALTAVSSFLRPRCFDSRRAGASRMRRVFTHLVRPTSGGVVPSLIGKGGVCSCTSDRMKRGLVQGPAPQPAQGRRSHRRGDLAAARRRHQLGERDHPRPPRCSTRSPTP